MGIRFFCPNGHRLNVKSFLAGKRGVCPDCGSPLEIPLESDARAVSSKKKSAKTGGGDDESAKATAVLDHPEADRPEVDISVPTSDHRPAHHDFALPPSLGLPTTVTAPATAMPVVPTPEFDLKSVRPAPVGVAPSPVAAVATVSPVSNGAPLPLATAPGGAAVASSVVASPPPVIPPANDPIAEAPMAIWYVRPTAGGQYGPARGDVMRKWLGEGRVTIDSLVWREGWPDWRPAAKVFPNLGSKPSTPAADMLPVTPEPRRPIRPSRKPSTAQGVGIVITLGLVCVGLFVALLLVLMNSGSGPTPTP